MGIIGIILGMKKVAGSPFLIIFTGIILFAQLAIVEDIQYIGADTGDSSILVSQQLARTGASNIHNGTGNIVIRAEHITSSSSVLFGDTVNCLEIYLAKTNNPPISTPLIVGVFSTTVTNGIAETKYEFGRMNVTLLTTDATLYKFCNTLSDYTFTIGDRFGVMYRSGDATNLVAIQEDTIDIFDSTITRSVNFNDATNVWANTANNDLYFTLTLEHDTDTSVYAFNDNDIWLFFILFGALFIMIGLMVQFAKW